MPYLSFPLQVTGNPGRAIYIWSVILCPPMHQRHKNCSLGRFGMREQIKKDKMHSLLSRRARFESKNWQLENVPNQAQIRDKAPTPQTTVHYWNLTNERCDYEKLMCLKSFKTGLVCARTIYYQYYTFNDYCTMQYQNCMAKFDNIFLIAYMGFCTELPLEKNLYVEMTYPQMSNNTKLKIMYMAGSADQTDVEGYEAEEKFNTEIIDVLDYQFENVTYTLPPAKVTVASTAEPATKTTEPELNVG